MNVIARLEYELAYYDSAVHRFNHYTRTPPSSVEGEELLDIIMLDILKFVVVNDKSYFFGKIGRENIFLYKVVSVYVHLSHNYHEIGFWSIDLLIVYGIAYVILFSFINERFIFCINNVVRKTIINKDMFYIFKLIK